VKAEKVGEDSSLGQLLSVLHKALQTDEPFHGRTDRLLRWFVPVVVALAVCTGFTCLMFGLSLEEAVLRSLTVLVISCPCTLGIAVPLARIAGISLAAANHRPGVFRTGNTLMPLSLTRPTITNGNGNCA
jgi:P-type E1-E2 ATPase